MQTMKRYYKDVSTGLAVVLRSGLFGDSLNNRKERMDHFGIEVTILPLSPLETRETSSSPLADAQEKACAKDCKWRQKKLGGNGGCYVNTMTLYYTQRHLFKENKEVPFIPQLSTLRATVWGDLSRLSKECLDEIFFLFSSKNILAYSNDIETLVLKDERYKHKVQASISSLEEYRRLSKLGFKGFYFGSKKLEKEVKKELLKEGFQHCLVLGDGKDLNSCSSCLLCDGTNKIISPQKDKIERIRRLKGIV